MSMRDVLLVECAYGWDFLPYVCGLALFIVLGIHQAACSVNSWYMKAFLQPRHGTVSLAAFGVHKYRLKK